jgi:3-phenylpropionate/cinnamic acid dioxygenase small subunit
VSPDAGRPGGDMADDAAEALEVVRRAERPRDSLAERLIALEDRTAIRELIARYGYLEDARRWDDMLDLYTDDIERELAGTLVETVRGKAALRERLVSPVMQAKSGVAAASRAEVEALGLRHLMARSVVRLADDGAHATATLHYTLVATREGAGTFARGSHEGSYVFDFRKEAGRWRFCRQLIVTDNAYNPMFRPSGPPPTS